MAYRTSGLTDHSYVLSPDLKDHSLTKHLSKQTSITGAMDASDLSGTGLVWDRASWPRLAEASTNLLQDIVLPHACM